MDGFIATPEWDRFRGTVQDSSVDWAKTDEGGLEAMIRAQANSNLTSLNVHPKCRDAIFITIDI
jgi:hypothetical protein